MPSNESFKDRERPAEVQFSNSIAAKAVEVVITNDSVTILKHMYVLHSAAKMLVDLSAAQDIELWS